MQDGLGELEERLWNAATELRANSGLKQAEYSTPVLGLIFLRFADARFSAAEEEIEAKASARRKIGPSDYRAAGVMFVPPGARYEDLLSLPEGADVGKAVDEAMRRIEEHNPDLADVLPRNYAALGNETLVTLLRQINGFTKDLEGDAFGLVYEYFLGKFAMSEADGGGEYFTPASIVRLIVEIIEPFHGRILDPACGSGGMFVHSAHFVQRHQGSPGDELSIFGQEKTRDTVKLARMNLAVHGLGGEILEGNSYYEDLHSGNGRFDFVMANPPFNVEGIDKSRLERDPRFQDIPKADNGNYLWIQMFATALAEEGRAGFVMANSASDAGFSEAEIRKRLVEDGLVDVMVAVDTNFFYTVQLPVTLWFLDRGKANTDRADKVLFIDARGIFRQIDRSHRDFSDEQIEFLANIVRLYREEEPEGDHVDEGLFYSSFPDGSYADVPGLCKVATRAEIEVQEWSLSPGRHVGTQVKDLEDEEFEEALSAAHAELRSLGVRASELEDGIDLVLRQILGPNG